jgi:hypothetical protein
VAREKMIEIEGGRYCVRMIKFFVYVWIVSIVDEFFPFIPFFSHLLNDDKKKINFLS